MALFPLIPFGAIQSSIPPPLFGVSNYKFPIKRGNRQRVGQAVFCNFSRQKYKKGAAALSEFEFQFGNLTVAQKEALRTFYVAAQGETDTWSMTFDGIGFSRCRFIGGFDAKLQGPKIWLVTLQMRAIDSSTQYIPVYTSGPGAPLIVPAVAATATITWSGGWNAISPLTFLNGQTILVFDVSHAATLAYVPASGGEGSTGLSSGHDYIKYGTGGTPLVEPNGGLGIGPVSLGTFTPGQEIILQIVTTGNSLGTTAGTIFYSGPGWRNADGVAHASVTWTVP